MGTKVNVAGVATPLVGGITPVQVTRQTTDISLAVAAAWTDSDTGGTAAARPLDVVIPGMAEGDGFDFRPYLSFNTVSGATLLNLAVIVGGATQRRLFPAGFGFLPWSIPTNQAKDVYTASPRFTAEAGDIENGSVRLRLQHIQNSNPRVVNASAAVPLWLEGRGPLA